MAPARKRAPGGTGPSCSTEPAAPGRLVSFWVASSPGETEVDARVGGRSGLCSLALPLPLSPQNWISFQRAAALVCRRKGKARFKSRHTFKTHLISGGGGSWRPSLSVASSLHILWVSEGHIDLHLAQLRLGGALTFLSGAWCEWLWWSEPVAVSACPGRAFLHRDLGGALICTS